MDKSKKLVEIEHVDLKDQYFYILNQLDDLGKAYLQLLLEFTADQSEMLKKLGVNEEDFGQLTRDLYDG
ncbi:unnamed protein product [marine sediment metagenome]|uniref:Uncharacterized protein n=1 Tax=marine sediment metagenome TaxID=412755 RepID=X1K1L5_9ZZZZ